jgi:hypothetical protein
MPIAIFVACLDTWEKNLQLDSYSGIFDEIVKLPPWTPRNAYVLIDKRLRDASAERIYFKNPFSHEAIAKVALLPNITTPRKWITQIKRILEGVPEILNPKANATQKSSKTEYKTMKGKKAAKEMAQTQHRCNTCQRLKTEYCGQCFGFNKHKANFTTMESYQ